MSDDQANDGLVDEATLAAYDVEIEEEGRELDAESIHRTQAPYPTYGPNGADGISWHEAFSAARAGAAAEIAVPPVRKLLVCADMEPSEAGLGTSVRKVLETVRAANWERVRLHSSLVAVSDSFYMDDSKKKPGQEQPDHRRGELKKPAHIAKHWWLRARSPRFGFSFRAHWIEGVTPKGGRSFAFQSASAVDPVGMLTEFFVSYQPSGDDLKPEKNEPASAHMERVRRMKERAERQDRAYNDGRSWLNVHPLFTSHTEFSTWLSESVAFVAQALSPTPKPDPSEPTLSTEPTPIERNAA